MSELRITTDAAAVDVGVVHRFLTEESTWARGIPRATVERAVAGSLNFSGFVGPHQVAYARVISDGATFAYLADVFVLETFRRRGHAKALVRAVVDHPRLQGLRRFLLATSDAHGLYARFGFMAPAQPHILMERYVADVYRR